MGALSSLRENEDTLAVQIANVYLVELDKVGIKNKYLDVGDIEIQHEVNLDRGFVLYKMRGNLGEKINDPDVKVMLPPDLWRGLQRGGKAYARHIKNIPGDTEMTELVKTAYTTLVLLNIGSKYSDAVKAVNSNRDRSNGKMNIKVKNVHNKIKEFKGIQE